MKAILEFTIPEDFQEHQDALKGADWKWAISDLLDYLRNQIKNADNSADEYPTFEPVRDRLTEILDERELRLH